jgi:hypothetical protein
MTNDQLQMFSLSPLQITKILLKLSAMLEQDR